MRKKFFIWISLFLLTITVTLSAVNSANAEEIMTIATAYDKSFSYNGNVQTYTVPVSGYYKLEVWGAAGGRGQISGGFENTDGYEERGARGGYSVGYVELKKNDTLYIAVGGKGADGNTCGSPNDAEGLTGYMSGGYNGGGGGGCFWYAGQRWVYIGAGGGATHIALNVNKGELKNYAGDTGPILIVAGGGAGQSFQHDAYRSDVDDLLKSSHYENGHGGGLTAGAPNTTFWNKNAVTATQSTGYKFGVGEDFGRDNKVADERANYDDGAGGGGGWYGGYQTGGGSGYIGGCLSTLTYGGSTYTSGTAAGNNSGNGKAAITYLGPTSCRQTVQVRYENVDGSFTNYENVINQDYGVGETVTWTRPADSTYQAAGVKYTVTEAKTTQVTVYRRRYLQTVQVRYENADGTFTDYEDVINKDYVAGATVTWSREADNNYQETGVSDTVTKAKTTQVTVYRQRYLQTVQVCYENADGTFTEYEDVIHEDYVAGATVTWSREADNNYQEASVSYTVTEAKTTQVTVYRQRYLQTVQVRYENADGTFTEYEDVINENCIVDSTVTWVRSADPTYQEAGVSYTVTEDAATQITIFRQKYTLTLEKGTGIDTVDGGGEYRAGQIVTIDAVVMEGYEFEEWIGSGGLTKTKVKFDFGMPTNNLSCKAMASPIEYKITYKLEGGKDEGRNPVIYTVESEDIFLEEPTRDGYSFAGWIGSNGSYYQKSVTIPKGSTGDKIYWAKWSLEEMMQPLVPEPTHTPPQISPTTEPTPELTTEPTPELTTEPTPELTTEPAPKPTSRPASKSAPKSASSADSGSDDSVEETEPAEIELPPILSNSPKLTPEPVIKGVIDVPIDNIDTPDTERDAYPLGRGAAAGVGGTCGGMIFLILFRLLRKCKIYDAQTEELIGKSIIRKDRKGMFWVKISDAVCDTAGTKIYIVFRNNFVRSNSEKPLKISARGKDFYRQVQEKVDIKI